MKNIRQPSYVSHTPASVTDNASFKLTVKTDPGEFPAYEVDIEAEDGEIRSIDASPSETEVTLTVPKNDEVGNREWAAVHQPGLFGYLVRTSRERKTRIVTYPTLRRKPPTKRLR